jgi:hypothetical protein
MMISDCGRLSGFCECRKCTAMLMRILALALATSVVAAADAQIPHRPGDALEFTPRYPLWSDGMDKRRWLHLPAGTVVDKSDADAWEFPRGARAWKEFSRDGKRVETRFIERLADGSWRYLTYAWNASGTAATLAPEEGIPERGIPSRADCLACHEGAPVPLLGYSAVQLSTALPPVLGYLHGNCGHCHNDEALPALELSLAQQASDVKASAARTYATLIGRASRFRPHGAANPQRVVPGQPAQSVLVTRMKSNDPLTRMPPLGVSVVDASGVALISRWIEHELQQANKEAP